MDSFRPLPQHVEETMQLALRHPAFEAIFTCNTYISILFVWKFIHYVKTDFCLLHSEAHCDGQNYVFALQLDNMILPLVLPLIAPLKVFLGHADHGISLSSMQKCYILWCAGNSSYPQVSSLLTSCLPSFKAKFTAVVPLTRIRDIAHRNGTPLDLKVLDKMDNNTSERKLIGVLMQVIQALNDLHQEIAAGRS